MNSPHHPIADQQRPQDSTNLAALNLRIYFRSIFVKHHALGSVHLASRSVNNDATSRPDQVFVDFPAGFVDIMGCLTECVTNRIVFPFRADNDSFTRLIRTNCALRARCGRACLRKRQWRDECASENDNCFLHDDPPFFAVDVLFMLRGSLIRRTGQPRCYSKQYMNWTIEQGFRFVNVRC